MSSSSSPEDGSSSSRDSEAANFSLTYATKTIPLRSLPEGAYLVHATNCLGKWGAGFALDLARVFPGAYEVYKSFCCVNEKKQQQDTTPDSNSKNSGNGDNRPSRGDIAGRCLVIPPQAADAPRKVNIVCLFTSYGYGARRGNKPGRDGVSTILRQTESALREFRTLLEERGSVGKEGEGEDEDGGNGVDHEQEIEVYSPLFNSGRFKVPWEETEALIQDAFKDWPGKWVVLAPP